MSERNPHEPRNEYQQRAFESGQEAMNLFMEKTHGAGSHKDLIDGMLHAFTRNHRTIQQETVKFFVQMLQLWGNFPEPRVSDGRNQATYKFAQKLIQDNDLYFPFI